MGKVTTKRPKVLLGKIPLMETRNGEKVSTSQNTLFYDLNIHCGLT